VTIIGAMFLALGQLSDPRFRAPLLKSLALSLATLVCLWIGLGYILLHMSFFAIPWLDTTLGAIGGLGIVVLTIVLFPAFVTAFLGLFLDAVADAVEARHYPQNPPPLVRSLGADIAAGVRVLVLALALNLLVLPLYLIPGLNIALFLAVNGFLLASEYVRLCLGRRVSSDAAKSLWRRHRGQAWLAGAMFAGLSLVPVVNLVVPVLAVAASLHLVESWLRVGTKTAVRE
jgi:CysZ protein